MPFVRKMSALLKTLDFCDMIGLSRRKVRRAKRRLKALVQSQSIKEYYTRSIVTGPNARCVMLTGFYFFIFCQSILHTDITIDVSTQKTLHQDVKLCAHLSYKYTRK